MRSAVIVGAGIGGLAAAIALRRGGWDVRVVEQAASPRELGFALALAPNALAALGELGLKDAVLPRGVEIKSFEVRRPDGRTVKRVDLRGDAVQSIVLLRPALHGVLLDTVGNEALILGRRVTALATTPAASPAADAAAVRLEDGRRIGADVVVGADGVGSAVRQALHPAEAAPRPSGYQALRGVSYDVGDRLGTADAAVYLGDGVEIGVARASASAVYWYISLVDGLAGADPAATLERCTRGLDPNAVAIMRAAGPDDMRPDRLFYRDPIADWGRGRVTLLGDAAHPVLPHTAQGAALALEDAVALGLALRDGDVESRLRLYERVRAPRTRKVVRTGPRIAAMTTTRNRMRIALRDVLTRFTPARALSATLTRHARDPHGPLRG
jgi:2-polyprenyl-6-methoxyphenol hydroxylase-like FAD-dependent oxidoreductase